MLILLFLDDGWLIDSDRDTCAVLVSNFWSDLRKSRVIINDLNGVRVKFSNGWGLYGTPLKELVSIILLSDCLVSAR